MDRNSNRGARVDVHQGKEEGVTERHLPLGPDVEFEVTGGAPVEIVLGMRVEALVHSPRKVRLVDWIPGVCRPECCGCNNLGLVVDRCSESDTIASDDR